MEVVQVSSSFLEEVRQLIEGGGEVLLKFENGKLLQGLGGGMQNKLVFAAGKADVIDRFLKALRRIEHSNRLWFNLPDLGAVVIDRPSDQTLEELK